MRLATKDRFRAKVERGAGKDACWLWGGSIDRYGYGKFGGGTAHRAAWALAHGAIPAGAYVCHRCDVRHCVRPSHLFLGDHRINTDDMVSKLRQNRRLSVTQVREAHRLFTRPNPPPLAQIAFRFGVTLQAISAIRLGITWSHITGVPKSPRRGSGGRTA